MLALKTIIDTFNTDEQQKFISYLKQKNKRHDIKNIRLFQLMAQTDMDLKSICNALYKTNNCNAFNALKKRLLQSLIDFTANKNLEDENSVDMQIIKYILASRTFLLQKNYDIAYKILDKAERLADANLLYPILNEIYHTKVQYAPVYPKANLESLIIKQRNNQKKHQLEDRLNIVYAQLKSLLNSANYKGQSINFESELQTILKQNNIQLNETLSFKSLYQILAIANISAFVSSSYFEIEDFVLKSYKILKDKKDTDKQLYYQIEIVYIIANTLFRNKKFESSLGYIDEMESLMLLKKGLYNKTFSLKKVLLRALNLNYLNKQEEAILLVEATIKKKHKDIESLLDLHLCLVMFYFQKGDLKLAKTTLSKFYHTDNYYIEKAGIDWVIKKNIAEILLYIELKDDDLIYSRIRSFKRRYTAYLNKSNQQRILHFITIAERIYNEPKIINDIRFSDEVVRTFELTASHQEDIFVISFVAWLKSKIAKKPLFELTLQLLNDNS